MTGYALDKVLRRADEADLFCTSPADLDALAATAVAGGFAVHRIDLAGVRDRDAFLDRIARVMCFPGWFGRNWDALEDCLSDLSWLAASRGHVVLLEHSRSFFSPAGVPAATARQVLRTAAEHWREKGVPFWIVMDFPAAGVPSLPAAS